MNVIEWFTQIPHFWLWFSLACALGIAELATGTLYLLCLALGALAAGVVSLVLQGAMEWVTFIVASFGFVFWLPRIAHKGTETSRPVGIDELVGQTGFVIKRIDPNTGTGMVKVQGQIWRAESDDIMEEGTRIIVERVKGNKLVVYPDPMADSHKTVEHIEEPMHDESRHEGVTRTKATNEHTQVQDQMQQ